MPVPPALRYVAYRALELPVWLGVPAVGWAWAGGSPDVGENVRAGSMAVALALHILTFNDWAGLRLNPNEAKRYVASPGMARALLVAALVSLVATLGLALSLSPLCAALALLAVGASALYSHPSLHLKSTTLGSTGLHFGIGSVQFLLGATAVIGPDFETLALSLFFGCLFVAGSWVHQVIDQAEDAEGGVQTAVQRIGATRALALARSSFTLAHAFLLALAFVGAVPIWLALLFSLPVPAHLRAGWEARRRSTATTEHARDYRFRYRALFGLATLLYVWISL